MRRVLRTAAGLIALAVGVTACGGDGGGGSSASGQTRQYFIAADDVEWDYAPQGNLIDPSLDEHAAVFIENVPYDPASGMAMTDSRIGSVYRKAQYREYTDETFTTLKPIAPEWEHLGILGPLIRAEVGDTIEVVFHNNAAFPVTVHPHGVFYDKDSEGAPYNDGTSGEDRDDDGVPPGSTHTYTWEVPERAGPGPDDGSSVLWLYHSHDPADTYTGLMGPIIISRAGATREDGTPNDVDREFITMFQVIDENASHYLADNAAAFTGVTVNEDLQELTADDEFVESNLMHAINGYVYGNLPGLTMRKGERVRWYILGLGTEIDLHTAHWHGQTALTRGQRTDVVAVLPATTVVTDMMPDNPGTWLYHCHVNDHIHAGMMALFTVNQ